MKNFGVREIRRSKKWGWWVLVIFLVIAAIVGYREQYKPRVEAKNYASYAAIVLAGVEIKLTAFESADEAGRRQILASLPRLQSDFYEITCPDGSRPFEIQWKMAKVFEYEKAYMSRILQMEPKDHVISPRPGAGSPHLENPIGRGEWSARAEDVQARIADLNLLINDTIEYGNFKRLR